MQAAEKAVPILSRSVSKEPLEAAVPRSAAALAAPTKPASVAVARVAPARAKPAAPAPQPSEAKPRAAEAEPTAAVATASRPQRCSDLVLKSSLDTLSPDEVTFQKTQCK